LESFSLNLNFYDERVDGVKGHGVKYHAKDDAAGGD